VPVTDTFPLIAVFPTTVKSAIVVVGKTAVESTLSAAMVVVASVVVPVTVKLLAAAVFRAVVPLKKAGPSTKSSVPVALVNTILLNSELEAVILAAINCDAVALPIIAPEILAIAAFKLVVLTVEKELFVADKSVVIILPKLPVVD
jgi:hypothetical protein